jgi:VWFA-related protein
VKSLLERSASVLAIGLVLGLLRPSEGRPQAAPQQPVFPTQAELVTVDVVVSDKAGAPVLGLTSEDFRIREDGVAQEIASFEAVHRPAAAGAGTGLEGDAARSGRQPEQQMLRVSSNREAPGRETASFVIVFDELHLDPAQAQRARLAVASFLDSAVADKDHVAVVGTASGARWTARLPEGRETLLQVVERFQGKHVGESVRDAMSDYEAMRIDQDRDPIVTDQVMRRFLATGEIQHDVSVPRAPADNSGEVDSWRSQTQARAAQVYARSAMRTEQTLGVMERALEALSDARGRKSLVLVSGGLVQDPRLAGFKRVVSQARVANTAIYFLDARGLVAAGAELSGEVSQPADIIDRSTGAWLGETKDASEGSVGLALDTGGLVVENRNDLAAGLARIGAESRSYYLIGYAPTNRAADGRFRKIGAEVAREGVVVRARRGYFAPGRGGAKKTLEPRDAAFQRALDAPFDLQGVALRVLAQVLGEVEPGKSAVLVTTEADIRGLAFAERAGAARDTLEFLLLVARRDVAEHTRFDQQFEMAFRPETRARFERTWFPVQRELKLAPGPYQAKVVARDRNSGRVGSVTHEFEVPAAAGLRVSSLVLGDRLAEGAPPAGGSLVPTARRSFEPSGTLHCRFEVYGAVPDPATGKPNVTAGFALRRRDGRVVAAAPESPLRPGPDGRLGRSLGASLDAAPPGRYEVIILVTDIAGGQAAEAREPILIQAPAEP